MADRTASFIATMLHSATVAHLMHFQAEGLGSDAAHRALAAYYDAIPDLVDTVAESIQGCYGTLIKGYPATFTYVETTPPLEYIRLLQSYVRETRKEMPQESQIQNEIDNVAKLLDETAYRLTFLK